MSVSPAVLRRVMRELAKLQDSPPEGIRIRTNENDMLDVTGIIQGPEGTPYAGGYFNVKFRFTEEFPAAPPKCWFSTKIFHPNVGPTGEICVNTLKKDWKSTYGIEHILVTVKCLLIYPNPESALDEEAGKLLLEDYDSYFSRAKLITGVHASRVKPVEFDTPSVPPPESTPAKKDSPEEPQPVASTSKLEAPTPVLAVPTPTPIITSVSTTTKSTLAVPTVSRKSASPAPPSKLPLPDKGNFGVNLKEKERHPSPSPLGTADANVGGGKPAMGVGLGMASTATMGGMTGTKAVKRSATGSATTGAEKRKKALKRL